MVINKNYRFLLVIGIGYNKSKLKDKNNVAINENDG